MTQILHWNTGKIQRIPAGFTPYNYQMPACPGKKVLCLLVDISISDECDNANWMNHSQNFHNINNKTVRNFIIVIKYCKFIMLLYLTGGVWSKTIRR